MTASSAGRRVVLVVVAALALWAVLVLLAAVFQRSLIFLPGGGAAPSAPADVEEVTLTTDDGLELVAWYLTPPDERVATILVAPGNAGDRSLRLPLARGLVERGHAVLLLEYRGYGGNPGRPHEAGLVADARAAHDHLEARDDVDMERVVLLGESLGTGVVAALAAERPPALVALRSPFPELADVGRSAYPFLPVRTLLRDRFPVTERLQDVQAPVLVVAGDADTIVPTSLSREVADALDASLVEVPGAGHNDRALLDGATYLDAVDSAARDVLDPSDAEG
jgi:fermentation-respiration switch protein FrsA (DUF1100 family)